MIGIAKAKDERLRQTIIGYSPEGDIGRSDELMAASICYSGYAYALEQMGVMLTIDELPAPWPWAPESFKPGDAIRCLEKASALQMAAIDAITAEREQNK